MITNIILTLASIVTSLIGSLTFNEIADGDPESDNPFVPNFIENSVDTVKTTGKTLFNAILEELKENLVYILVGIFASFFLFKKTYRRGRRY